MTPEKNFNGASTDEKLTDWQKMLVSDTVAATPPVVTDETVDEDDGDEAEAGEELACGVCYRPFEATELTVASKERFNWEASVVVCPECLTELKLEMRERSSGPDLLLGVVWAVLGTVVTAILLSLTIWSVRNDPNYNFWQWIGSYFAFVPGFVIGRFVRYGVGKRQSLEQQLIAMFFTLVVVVVTAYVGWVADNNSFYSTIIGTEAPLVLFSVPQFLTNRFFPALSNFAELSNIIPRLGTNLGILLGLAVAFFTSEGERIYSRPFVKGAKK